MQSNMESKLESNAVLDEQPEIDLPEIEPVITPDIDPDDSDWTSYTRKMKQRAHNHHPAQLSFGMNSQTPEQQSDAGDEDDWIDAAGLSVYDDGAKDKAVKGDAPRDDVPVVDENAPEVKNYKETSWVDQAADSIAGPVVNNPVGRVLLGGATDAINGLLDTADEIGQAVSGESYVSFNLPTIPEGDSAAEGMARDITQFMSGYAALGGLKLTGMGIKTLAKASAAGAAADSTFDPTEGNISTMLRELELVDNSITRFFDSKVGDDASAEQRLRGRMLTATEGALVGAGIDTFISFMRWAKNNPGPIQDAVRTVLDKTMEFSSGGIIKEMPLEMRLDAPVDEIMTTNMTSNAGMAMQSSEALPSTGLLSGRIIARLPIEKQELYQSQVNELTDGMVEKLVGLKRIDSATTPSRFQGHIGASQQITYKIETELNADGFIVPTAKDREKLKRAAAVKGYIQDQDAVVNSFLAPVKGPSDVNAVSFNIGRVLTHDEMMSVDAAIDEVAKSLGVNPDHIATPTTKDGINLLNVSFGGIDALQFSEVATRIKDVLGATEYDYFNNTLLDDGYIGGFDGYKTGQKAYDSISRGDSGNTGTSNGTEQWWGHANRVEQAREKIRTHREKFLAENTLPTKTIRQIGEESDALAKQEKRVIKRNDYSNKAHTAIASQMYDEVDTILKGGDKDASGWYTARFQTALDTLANKHPELAPGKDQSARDLYTTFVAITSDGAKVSKNLEFADDVYKSYKKTGKVNTHIPSGDRSASYKKNLNVLQRLIDDKGVQGTVDFLSKKQLVRDIEKETGVKLSGFSKSAELPNSTIFGPKLGMFWANLMGQPEYLTMDRWWSRTFNRYRGTMADEPTPQSIATFKKLLGRPNAQLRTVKKEAARIVKAFSDRGFKDGTPLEKAANNVHKGMTRLKDAPQNTSDRAFQTKVTKDVVGKLKAAGYTEMTASDLQAILWYGEKRRMKEFGSVSPINEVDYMDVTSNIAQGGKQ